MARILVLAPFAPEQLELLREAATVTYESWLDTRRIQDPDDLTARLRDERTAVLVVESDFVFDDLLDRTPDLRLIGVCRSSVDHVDVAAATRNGVAVVNTPARNARAVAEHCLGLMLALARRIPAADRYVRDGQWQNPAEPYISMRGIELSGRTLGVVGLGAIGGTLAEIGLAMGMKVAAFDPYVARAPEGVAMCDLETLIAQADFVSVHVPSVPETQGLMDERLLARMKPTAFLVSASDAAVFQQDALARALSDNRIAGAAFDVFETHPVSPQSPLVKLDNVLLSPHLGGATAETVDRHSRMMTEDILRFLEGVRPIRMVNPEVWSRVA
jgi:phosphoglycerate dehydrogenase-like enzyme